MRKNELPQLSKASREAVLAVVDTFHRLGLPHLAGIIYPVCHPEWPVTEQDALERCGTVRMLLKSKPMVLAQVEGPLAHAEARLHQDVPHRRVA